MNSSENAPSLEYIPKRVFIHRNEPALITLEMGKDFENELKELHFSKRMYFEDRIDFLKSKLKESKGLFEITATESALEIKPITASYQFQDEDIMLINEVLDRINAQA